MAEFPNFAAALQQGYTFGTNQRLQREGEKRQATLRDLASRAYAAPAQERQPLIQQAIATDPDAGFALGGQIEKREADQAARAGNVADYLLQAFDSKNPAQIQGAYNAVKPYFQGIAPPGAVIPDVVDESILPILHQLKAASAGANVGLTNEARTFDQLTAGLTPEEKAQARKVNVGILPRAVTGAAKQFKVTGADGRDRIGIFDPSTRGVVVFDETVNGFRPLGQGETVSEAAPMLPTGGAMAGTGQATTRVDIQGIAPDAQQRIAQTAALMAQSGYPQAEIDAFVDSQVNRPQPAPMTAPAPIAPTTVPSGFGVSRTPEEQVRLSEQAKIDAEIANYTRMTELAAQREAATTAAQSEAKAAADRANQAQSRVSNAERAIPLIEEAKRLLPAATGSGLGAARDVAARQFGLTTEGAQAAAQLDIVAPQLVGMVPRFEGPQSDADRRLYEAAAGDLNNRNKTVGERVAAANQMLRLHQKAISGQGRYQIGQVIEENGKRYRVTDVSDLDDPDVEEIR